MAGNFVKWWRQQFKFKYKQFSGKIGKYSTLNFLKEKHIFVKPKWNFFSFCFFSYTQ